MKTYETINGQEYQISVDYNLGGTNYFTSKTEKRGYYLHIQPVTREVLDNGFVSIRMEMFSGAKMLLREVKRKSDKQYALAVKDAELGKIDELFSLMGINRNESKKVM